MPELTVAMSHSTEPEAANRTPEVATTTSVAVQADGKPEAVVTVTKNGPSGTPEQSE